MPPDNTTPSTDASPARKWYHRVGPGLITACVVIGPGSILTSSKVGATHGFALLWVVVLAVVFMLIYMSLGAKLGVLSGRSCGDLVTDKAGRWLAVIIGLAVFFISAAFQFGNNLGVHSAFAAFIDFDYVIVLFNAMTIAFLFSFRNIYRALERLMMTLVAIMLLCFAANLMFAMFERPALGELAAGFVPHGLAKADLSLLGLVGTTFVITAAYFQAYLVQQKGWSPAELKDGLLDARIGAVIMCLITIMLISTAACVLRGKQLTSVGEVASSLEPLFGQAGLILFCLGLFSAAYSSFMVNSMIGGFILSDGLGLGSRPTDLGPKVFTTMVLLTGMGVAQYVILRGNPPVAAIVAAQAVTVVAAPVLAGALWWLTNQRDAMGEQRNGRLLNVAAGLGFLLLLALAWYIASEKVLPAVREWWFAAA